MITNISELEQNVAELRTQPIPSTQLIDALNALSHALSPIDVERAIEVSKEAHKLAFLLRHHLGMAVSLARLSWLHLEGGAFDTAIVEAHQAEFLAEQLHDYVLTTRAVYVLAHAQIKAGNFATAEKFWQRLIDIARANNDLMREADYLNSFGNLFEEQRDFHRAQDYYRQAHDLFVQAADENHILAKNNLAYALTMRGQHQEALALSERSLALCDPDWKVWRALFLNTLGVIHMNLRQYDSARSEFTESLTISLSSAGRKTSGVEALLNIARLNLVTKRMPDTIEALNQAVDLASKIKAVPLQMEAQRMLYRIYASVYDQTRADEHHDVYLGLKNRIAIERIERQVGLFRAEAEVAQLRPIWLEESKQLLRGPLGSR